MPSCPITSLPIGVCRGLTQCQYESLMDIQPVFNSLMISLDVTSKQTVLEVSNCESSRQQRMRMDAVVPALAARRTW